MTIDRLAFDGNVRPILERACDAYEIGSLESYDEIEVGFEDYNVKVQTAKGIFVAKLFSKQRDAAEIHRNIAILEAVNKSDISHPSLHRQPNGDIHYKDSSGLSMVVMDYIEGDTLYSENSVPSKAQLELIAAEAVKINNLEIEPEFIFDKWAIPNIHWMFEKVNAHISADMSAAITSVITKYDAIDIESLPKCFVHGDIIKSNVIIDRENKPYIIDFSVSNIYPKVQEIAVMAANLLAEDGANLESRTQECIDAYVAAGGELTDYERSVVYDYSLAGVAMEYMGSVYERVFNNEEGEEVDYWQSLAEDTLKRREVS